MYDNFFKKRDINQLHIEVWITVRYSDVSSQKLAHN